MRVRRHTYPIKRDALEFLDQVEKDYLVRDENKEVEDLVKLFIKVKPEKSVTFRCPGVLKNVMPCICVFDR